MKQNKELEKLFFDGFALEKVEYDVFDEDGYKTLLEEFQVHIKPKQRELLIDLGCGTGAFSKRLLSFGLRICILDISTKCLEVAARVKRDHFQPLAADIEYLPFNDESVDIVTYSGVLHHFADFKFALKEGYRVLKPGGRLFAYDPHIKNPLMWLYRSKESPFHSKKGRTPNERLLSISEIQQELEKIGFSSILVKAVSGIGFNYIESRIIRSLLGFYNFKEKLFKGTVFASEYGSFVLSFAQK